MSGFGGAGPLSSSGKVLCEVGRCEHEIVRCRGAVGWALLVISCVQRLPDMYVEGVDGRLEVGMLGSFVVQDVVCARPIHTLLVRPSYLLRL